MKPGLPRRHEFDVGRDPNPHVAFGGGGPHFCLGASLARLELRVVLEELVSRYQAVEVTGPGRPAPVKLPERHQAPAGPVHLMSWKQRRRR